MCAVSEGSWAMIQNKDSNKIAQSGTDCPSVVRAADQTNELHSGNVVLAVAAGDLISF
jgi:hypothetical protein